MKVYELQEWLEQFDDDVEVKLLMQPRWAFVYSFDCADQYEPLEDENGNKCVYLYETRQEDYASTEQCQLVGWR